jgi:protein-S-isoprenylcysteine O-methyltransferase Ste14
MKLQVTNYRPPRIALALLLSAATAHYLLPVHTLKLFNNTIIAVVLGAAGFAVMMQAWWQFRVRQVAIRPTAKTARLLTDGIYRFSRNPMYLGMSTMIAAVAVFAGTLPFYAAFLVYIVIIDRGFCRYEEEKLAKEFPTEYPGYRQNVRRWL